MPFNQSQSISKIDLECLKIMEKEGWNVNENERERLKGKSWINHFVFSFSELELFIRRTVCLCVDYMLTTKARHEFEFSKWIKILAMKMMTINVEIGRWCDMTCNSSSKVQCNSLICEKFMAIESRNRNLACYVVLFSIVSFKCCLHTF